MDFKVPHGIFYIAMHWLAQKYMITFSRRHKAFVVVINRHQLIFYWNFYYIYSAVIYLQIRVKLLSKLISILGGD